MKRLLILLALSLAVVAPAFGATARPLAAGDVPTVTIAPIAARTPGTYQTTARSVPAGTYQEITFVLTFNNQPVDFVAGDVIDGAIQLSTDGGQTWAELCSTDWQGGVSNSRTGGWSLAIENITIPPGTTYRARATVSSADGSTVTFGVTATVTASN